MFDHTLINALPLKIIGTRINKAFVRGTDRIAGDKAACDFGDWGGEGEERGQSKGEEEVWLHFCDVCWEDATMGCRDGLNGDEVVFVLSAASGTGVDELEMER